MFSDMTCDAYDAETLAQTKERNADLTIVFTDNGFTITQLSVSVVQTGAYTQDGEAVTMKITGMTMNGNQMDVGEGITARCTYDGDVFVMASQVSADTVVYSMFTLKTI